MGKNADIPYEKWEIRVVLHGPTVLLGVWLITAVVAVCVWDACQFQNLGSLFVAIAVFLFAFTNSLQAKLRNWWVKHMMTLEGNKAILRSCELFLGKLNKLKLIPQDASVLGEIREHGIGSAENSAKKVEDLLSKIQRKSIVFEAILLIFGTLQWGYGDYLHNLLRGNGWTPC